jgi:hypothetical protein
MRTKLVLTALAAMLAGPALAEPTTKTVTVDTPKYEGSRIISRDKEAGVFARDAELTRKSDGATATSEYDRVRTEDGFTASGSQTGFNGKTRSFELDRTRTENGSSTEGTYTGRGGETYALSGSRERGDSSLTANQNIVKNSTGETVYNRDVSASRANGQVTRSVDVTRKQGFHGPQRLQPWGKPGRRRR